MQLHRISLTSLRANSFLLGKISRFPKSKSTNLSWCLRYLWYYACFYCSWLCKITAGSRLIARKLACRILLWETTSSVYYGLMEWLYIMDLLFRVYTRYLFYEITERWNINTRKSFWLLSCLVALLNSTRTEIIMSRKPP